MREGAHDLALRWVKRSKSDDVLEQKFKENIHWLLSTYQPLCQHIIWIGNTGNGNERNNKMFPVPKKKNAHHEKY